MNKRSLGISGPISGKQSGAEEQIIVVYKGDNEYKCFIGRAKNMAWLRFRERTRQNCGIFSNDCLQETTHYWEKKYGALKGMHEFRLLCLP